MSREPNFNTTPVNAEELEKLLPSKKQDTQETAQALSQRDSRALAFYLIYAMEQSDYELSLGAVVDNFRRGFELDIADDSFAVLLARGVVEEYKKLDTLIEPYLKNWKLERLGFCTRLILRMALWELSTSGAIPNVIINEAIELAKAFSEKDAYKFVNGVLDQFVKGEKKSNDGSHASS
jgi:N utilization substance protein B